MIRRIPITGPSIITLVALALAIVVVVMHIPGLLVAAFSRGAGDEDPANVVAQLMDDHERAFELYQDRFIGRSLFYKPPAPAPKRVVSAPRVVTPPPTREKPKPPPPAAPTGPPPNYQGPSIQFVVGTNVWFKPKKPDSKELKISVGQTREGVTVISCDKLPYSVLVGYGGGEYDVPIFDPNTLFKDESKTASSEHPGIEAAPAPAVMPVSNPAPRPRVTAEEVEAKKARYSAKSGSRDNDDKDDKDEGRDEREKDDTKDGESEETPPSLR